MNLLGVVLFGSRQITPCFLSAISHCGGVRTPPGTQVNCAFSVLGFPRFFPSDRLPGQLGRVATPLRFEGGGRISLARPFAQFTWDYP